MEHVRTVDVGQVKKQRWNGCKTGDGQVEGSFVGDGQDSTGPGKDEDRSQIKDAEFWE